MRVNAYVEVVADGGEPVLRCRCGHVLGPATESYKRYSLEARYQVQEAGPLSNPYGLGGDRFELREYYCPRCVVRYESEVALRSDPVLHDVELHTT